MKLILSGRPYSLKIDKDGKEILVLELPVDNLNLQEILPFVKRECDLHIQSSKRDLDAHGYIEELALKSKLKLKVRCIDDVDLNVVNQLISDPETTTIVFDDKQATLTDYEIVKARQDKNRAGERKVMAEAQAFLNAETGDTKNPGGKTYEVVLQKFEG